MKYTLRMSKPLETGAVRPADEPIATLIPGEYTRQLNQVAAVTPERILFLRRKFVSKTGWEIVPYPLASCTNVRYRDERPIWIAVSGVLLATAITAIFGALVYTWYEGGSVEVSVKALALAALAGLYGVRRMFGARRHRLSFATKDRSTLEWRSRPGEYTARKADVDRLLEFLRGRGLLQTSMLVRK